ATSATSACCVTPRRASTSPRACATPSTAGSRSTMDSTDRSLEWPELNDLRADIEREERRRREERERERHQRAERLDACRDLLDATETVHLLRLMNEYLLRGRGVVEQSEEQVHESSAAARLRWLGPD